MATGPRATLSYRIAVTAAITLGFTSLALPFSRGRLSSRSKSLLPANAVAFSIQQTPTAKRGIETRPTHPRAFLSRKKELVEARLASEYGAIFVAQGVVPPPREMFSSEKELAAWQASIATSGGEFVLQTAAAEALEAARSEAEAENLDITPRDTDAAARDYAYTVDLWMSRVNPGLDHWVQKGRLSQEQAERIRQLPSREQLVAILHLEKSGIFLSKDFSKSILYSVAPPGTSQHLALLAFDVKEHEDPRVREILERHGWFQTVRRDEPHFTYLGAPQSELPSLGLTKVTIGQRHYWVPRPATADANFLASR